MLIDTRHWPWLTTARRGGVLLKLAIVGAVVVVGGIGAAIALRGGSEAPAHAAVELQPISRTSFDITVTANGELKAKRQKDLKSELERETTVVEVVEEGSFVKKDDTLVKLNSDEISKQLKEEEDRLRSAENDVRVAENALEIQRIENESATRQAQTKIDLGVLELEKWQSGDDKEQRQTNALAIEKGTREVERLGEKLDQSRRLHERGFLSTDELKQDETAFLEAQSNLATANLRNTVYEEYTRRKEETKLQSDLEEAKKDMERVVKTNDSNLSTKESQLDLARANLRQRQSEVTKMREQLVNTEIKAPTDGLVVYATSLGPDWRWDDRGPIAVGRKIYPNESIITLPDTSEMIASIKVHESLIARIKAGQRTLVTIDAAQGRVFEGTVESTGIIAQSGGWSDPNLREYEVKIALNLPSNHGLKPSMRCEAKIILDHVNDVVAVPLQAVFIDKAVNYVYTPSGNRYVRTPVRVGRRSDVYAEITDGASEGLKVLMKEPAIGLISKGDFSDEIVAKYAASPRGEHPDAPENAAHDSSATPAQATPAEEKADTAVAAETTSDHKPESPAAAPANDATTSDAATTEVSKGV